jgi:hypothetical protein
VPDGKDWPVGNEAEGATIKTKSSELTPIMEMIHGDRQAASIARLAHS